MISFYIFTYNLSINARQRCFADSRCNIFKMVVGKLFSFGVLLVSVFVGIKFYDICKVPPLPNLPDDQYWGPGKAPSTLDTSVRPFKIEFPEEVRFLNVLQFF